MAALASISEASMRQPSTPSGDYAVPLAYKGRIHYVSLAQADFYNRAARIGLPFGIVFVPMVVATIFCQNPRKSN
jgi:hypothetical protein